MPAEIGRDAHAQIAFHALGHARDALTRFLQLPQHAAGIDGQLLSGGGQGCATDAAVEQERSHFLFQILDLPAQGRLRDMQSARRFGHAAVFDHAEKIAQMTKFDHGGSIP